MKYTIFASLFLCLALNARAQVQQQIDSTPAPTQGSWVIVNSGTTSGFGSVSWPTRDTVWASASDGLHRSTDGGWTWTKVAAFNGKIIFHTGSDGILSGGSDKVFHTTNAGQTWDTLITGLPVGYAIIAWPSVDTMLSAGDGFISRSTDGGKSWAKGTYPGGNISAFGFGTSTIGYSVGDFQSCFDQHTGQTVIGSLLLKTVDAGLTWSEICNTIYPQGSIQTLACYDAINALTVGAHGRIERSSNGGTTWDSISSGLSTADELLSIAVSGSSCYATSESGLINSPVINSTDSGRTWQKINIPTSHNMNDVKIFDDTDVILVGDSGTILKYSSPVSGVNQTTKDSLSVVLFPDPAQQSITVQYSLPQHQNVAITIFDASGNLVQTVFSSLMEQAGLQNIPVSTTTLIAGSYFLHLESNNYASTIPFTITR